MELALNSCYLATFGAGTLVGGLSAYFIMRSRRGATPPASTIWKPGMEENFEVRIPK